MNTQKTSYRGAVSVSFISMFFLGGGNILLSATKESLMAHFGVGLFEIGLLFTIRSVVCGLIPFICGGLSDRFGRKAMILIGGGLFALYYFFIPSASSFVPVYFIILIYGVAYSFVDPSGMAILFDALDNPTPALPFIQVFYALGSILSPLVVSWLMSGQYSWKIAYYLYLGLALLMCVYVALVRFPPTARHAAGPKKQSPFGFASEPKPLREGLYLFLFAASNSAVYSAVTNWSDIYMKDVFGYSDASSVQVLSFIQVGSLLGSLFMSRVARRLPAPQILRLWPLSTTITLALALLMPTGPLYIAFIMFTSFTAGCLFSIVVGYAGMLFYKNSGASSGAISSASAAGIALCSFLTGRLVGPLGVRTVFAIMGIFGIFSVLLGQLVHHRHKQLLQRSE